MIAVRNLSKTFPGGVTAVKSVSFEVPSGTTACLIGTSGCGKTTTLKMINRLIESTSGEILVNEQPVSSLDVISLRRSIGYVVQKGGLLPHISIERNIALIDEVQKKPANETRKRVRELMELVHLDPDRFARRYPIELSGGQQQRVGIARALMANPPVLLMDEPFSALDPITRSHLHKEFIDLNKQLKKTILMVTHDLSEAFKLGTQIILMAKGEITQKGPKKDFLENPVNDFAAEFVKSQIEGIVE